MQDELVFESYTPLHICGVCNVIFGYMEPEKYHEGLTDIASCPKCGGTAAMAVFPKNEGGVIWGPGLYDPGEIGTETGKGWYFGEWDGEM